MSNEMNLYKRCKNIFKFHGVDMGGGGSGGELDIVIDLGNDGETPVLVKGDYDTIDAKIGSGIVNGVVTTTVMEAGASIRASSPIVFAGNTGAYIMFLFYSVSGTTPIFFTPDGELSLGE